VLEREDIYQRVWGYTMVRGDRSVDVFVRKLRQKLERLSPGWRYVHTHFGVGYRFAAEPAEDDAPTSSEPSGKARTNASAPPPTNAPAPADRRGSTAQTAVDPPHPGTNLVTLR
jgi:DNA-binding winged helix-turn-helix (wHTH) protein